MKTFTKLTIALLMAMVPLCSWGQAKVYTKKAKMADFTTNTTKVVLSSDSPLESALRSEISSRWRVSPYEFCSVADYEAQSKDFHFYFLRLVSEDGVAFLSLEKGGNKDSENNFEKPFEVVRIPVAPDGNISGKELMYLGAYLDVIQSFSEKCMESDRIGYAGLGVNNLASLKGKSVYFDEDRADLVFTQCMEGAVVPIIILSSDGKICYRMLLSADSHEVLYYAKGKVKDPKSAGFTDMEIKSFAKRNAEIIRTIPVDA